MDYGKNRNKLQALKRLFAVCGGRRGYTLWLSGGYHAVYEVFTRQIPCLTNMNKATHMAQGYAKFQVKLGAMATSDSGAAGLVTGIADAQIDSTGFIAGRSNLLLGTDAFQNGYRWYFF